MRATEELVTEHGAIKRMLQIIEGVSRRLEAGERVATEDLEAIVEFIRVFADKCHHAKEEGLLFPAMVAAGIPQEQGPIGVMLSEHVTGRGYVGRMADAVQRYEAGDQQAAGEIAENARGYAALLAQHIDKEDHILYPMADSVLSDDRQRELLEEFEVIERDVVGAGKHEEFHELLDRLEGTYVTAP